MNTLVAEFLRFCCHTVKPRFRLLLRTALPQFGSCTNHRISLGDPADVGFLRRQFRLETARIVPGRGQQIFLFAFIFGREARYAKAAGMAPAAADKNDRRPGLKVGCSLVNDLGYSTTLTVVRMSSVALGSPAAGPCHTLPPKVVT